MVFLERPTRVRRHHGEYKAKVLDCGGGRGHLRQAIIDGDSWSASFPDPRTRSHVTRGVAGRRTIPANHAAGKGKEASLGSRNFGGAATRCTRIKTNHSHSLDGRSVAEAQSVSRLCDRSAADACPALTQTASTSALCPDYPGMLERSFTQKSIRNRAAFLCFPFATAFYCNRTRDALTPTGAISLSVASRPMRRG